MVSCLLLILTYPYIIAEFYAELNRTDPYAGLDSGNVDALKHCRQPQPKRLRSCPPVNLSCRVSQSAHAEYRYQPLARMPTNRGFKEIPCLLQGKVHWQQLFRMASIPIKPKQSLANPCPYIDSTRSLRQTTSMESLQLGAPRKMCNPVVADRHHNSNAGQVEDNPSLGLTANAGFSSPTSEAPIESTRQTQNSLPSERESDTATLLVSSVHRLEAGLSPVARDQQTLSGVGKSPWEVDHGLH